MGRKLIPLLSLLAALLILSVVVPLQASDGAPVVEQAATAVPTTSTAGSTVQFFFIACNDRAVINFSGNMLAGYDIYYSVSTGTTALTSLRRVQVSGAYQVSDTATYATGTTLAAGAGATVQVSIARESDSTRTTFQGTAADVNDGCNSPQFAPATSIDSTTAAGAFPNPVGTTVPFTTLPDGVGSGILSPFGGFLNSTYVQQAQVAIGPRDAASPVRSSNPGVVFAECNDAYPAAYPGVLYDNDNIIIFWSWYTRTAEQMQAHVDNAQYSVTLNNAILPSVEQTEPRVINGNYWTFYIARVGNLVPGYYGVAYRLTWELPVNDGYDDYGPGTENEELAAQCDFRILGNTAGVIPSHNRSYTPWLTPNGYQPPITR